jgi:hypothetical protein
MCKIQEILNVQIKIDRKKIKMKYKSICKKEQMRMHSKKEQGRKSDKNNQVRKN